MECVFASTRLTSAVLSGALTCALVTVAIPSTSTAAAPDAAPAARPGAGDGTGLDRFQRRALQDSGTVMELPRDGTSEITGDDIAPRRRACTRGVATTTSDASYDIAPGMTIREWDQVDGCGALRFNLLSINMNAADWSLDYLGPQYIPQRKTVSQLGAADGAIAAVNADFFDISDTGAPLSVGVDRERGLVHGPREGWIPENATFYLDSSGPHIGPMTTRVKLRQRPRWPVSGFNAPTVTDDTIGLYDTNWGWTKGYSVTDGDQDAREVVVVNGRIVSNKKTLSKGRKVKGQVLVGRGTGAKLLKQLKVGTKASFKFRPQPGAEVAVSGDRALVVNGVRTVVNDSLMHPRTAIGIDADAGRLLLLVVDGRSASSRGYTMVETANLMLALGAENALNFDGGGSSAMYSRKATGEMGLINEPSDGGERKVANGLGIFYNAPYPPIAPPVVTVPAPAPPAPVPPAPVPTTPVPTAPPTTPPPAGAPAR